jgi:zeaxanthin glucosyltransferase
MIICLPERGGYYPTFAIAQALQARGHTVLYPGVSDFREDVERQGIKFLTLFPDMPTLDPDHGEIPHNLFKKLLYFRNKAAENPKRFQVMEAIANGDLEAMLKEHKVDVVLLDPFLSPLAAVCKKAGVEVVSMATELMNYKNHAIPPSCTLQVPSRGPWSRAMSHSLWAKHFLLAYLKRIGLFLVTRTLFWPRPPRELKRKLNQVRRQAGYASIFSEYSWRFDLPEMALCPRAFEFPDVPIQEGRRYFGVTIDRSRVEVPMDHEIPPHKKLVYASLGTHAAMYGPGVDRFIRLLIEVAKRRTDCHFLVNIGKGNKPEKFEGVPENVHLTNFVPQLQILDRSAAIITNGGLGTVKEAIMAEVPLLVAPCRWDQFGNSARVKAHGIGERCDLNRVTDVELEEHLDRILNDPTYKNQLARMKGQIERDKELEKGLQWLTDLARREAPASG